MTLGIIDKEFYTFSVLLFIVNSMVDTDDLATFHYGLKTTKNRFWFRVDWFYFKLGMILIVLLVLDAMKFEKFVVSFMEEINVVAFRIMIEHFFLEPNFLLENYDSLSCQKF